MTKIMRNAIRCNHCGDVIESTPENPFVRCSCGICGVEGAHAYLRREFDSVDDYEELSEFVELNED